MPILTYHHIGSCPAEQEGHRGIWVSEELFSRHLGWLRAKGFASVGLEQVREALEGGRPLPGKWVAITFDDGWRDNYATAMPLLIEHGFSATVFAVTGSIRRGPPSGGWDDCLSAEEIREMRAKGFDIGSHTRTHPRLSKMDDASARAELEGSRSDLLQVLGEAPAWLAYPYGWFSPRVARIARDCGYHGAVSTIRDNRVSAGQLFWLPRVMVMGDTTVPRLAYMMSCMYHLVHSWKNRTRWREAK
jgi:peptidoglycan/xylan/chitin deacetylase (PgdA/CDA1 family)